MEHTKLKDKRIAPMRVSAITKFVIEHAAAEMGISRQDVMEKILCQAFPAYANNYKAMNKEK